MLIHQLPLSLYSFKVRLALRLKGIDVELREPPGGSYRSPEYRAINPAGTIPALIDGGRLIAESDAIIEYLDDIGLGQPLRPADPWLAARQRMLSRWCDMRLEPAVRKLFPFVGLAESDAVPLAEADLQLAARLELMEQGLDAEGPFAVGAMPGIADCGFAATVAWLQPLCAVLGLRAVPGPRLSCVAAGLAARPETAGEFASYRALIDDWIAERR